jgi:uroporphyrinogen decarboxylase
MAEMNSRQRVVTALEHREPDRVPFDCTFGYVAYSQLEKYLGFKPEQEVYPGGPWLNVRPPVAFLQELQIDLYYLGLMGWSGSRVFEYGMDSYQDEWGVRYHKVENPSGLHYEFSGHPLAGATIKNLEDYPWPDPTDPVLVEGLEEKARWLYENTDFALVGKFSNSIFEHSFMLRGMEQLYMDLSLDPDFVGALMERLTDIAIGLVKVGLEACGKYLQILRLAGDDMGHQRGTLLNPKMFREMVKPRFARLYREAKRLFLQYNPNGKLMAHTDGDVYPLIPDYIEMGLDVLNPVQPYVAEMEHDKLKHEFGGRLAFHGGIDLQKVLPFGTPEQVRAEAVKVMRDLGSGGGYILAPTHYLLPDVPPQNVIALRDAVMECGGYPLERG